MQYTYIHAAWTGPIEVDMAVGIGPFTTSVLSTCVQRTLQWSYDWADVWYHMLLRLQCMQWTYCFTLQGREWETSYSDSHVENACFCMWWVCWSKLSLLSSVTLRYSKPTILTVWLFIVKGHWGEKAGWLVTPKAKYLILF